MGLVSLSAILLSLVLTSHGTLGASMRWKMLLFGPAILFLGISGAIYLPSLPDPKPVGGPIGAVGEAGSPAMIVGGALIFIGLGLGGALLVLVG